MINRRLLVGAGLASIAVAPVLAADDRAGRNAALIRRYFDEVWNTGRLETLDEILAPDYLNHTPSVPNPVRGPAGLKPIVLAIRCAFPDLHYSIEDVIANESEVVARVTMTGTHEGDLFGLPATHKSVRVNQINMRQLGAVR